MTGRQLRQYQMLVRLQEFGVAHAKRFAEDTFTDEAFESIGRAVSELDTYAQERLMARRQNVLARAAARRALMTMMERITQTARVLKAEDPEFVNTFLMPVQQGAESVLTVARTFAQNVEPLVEKFKGHSFGKTFPENFKQLLKRYEQAVRARESAKGLTAEARATIAAAILSGLAAARSLDIIVANELSQESVVFARWRRDRRVGYRAAKESLDTGVPDVPSAPTAPGASSSTEARTKVSDALETSTPVDVAVSNTPEVSEAAADTEVVEVA